ncbi:MAG: hypothetical protein DMF68_02840 [Acidobacteria bacterium]|nr:MAG: hypothetical protein DMF68_02840 [Acidobacteriota bacterium]
MKAYRVRFSRRNRAPFEQPASSFCLPIELHAPDGNELREIKSDISPRKRAKRIKPSVKP